MESLRFAFTIEFRFTEWARTYGNIVSVRSLRSADLVLFF